MITWRLTTFDRRAGVVYRRNRAVLIVGIVGLEPRIADDVADLDIVGRIEISGVSDPPGHCLGEIIHAMSGLARTKSVGLCYQVGVIIAVPSGSTKIE